MLENVVFKHLTGKYLYNSLQEPQKVSNNTLYMTFYSFKIYIYEQKFDVMMTLAS